MLRRTWNGKNVGIEQSQSRGLKPMPKFRVQIEIEGYLDIEVETDGSEESDINNAIDTATRELMPKVTGQEILNSLNNWQAVSVYDEKNDVVWTI